MTTNTCLDANLLAAFAEGSLAGADRRRAVAHISRCTACKHTYTELLRFRAEQETELVDFPRAKRFPPFRGGLAVAAAALIAILIWRMGPTDTKPWRDAGYWLERHARLDSERAARAGLVFQRMRASAGGLEDTELVMIGSTGEPLALALDGAVVLSAETLALCFDDVATELGDARLALVLGHELEHARNGEHVHAFAAHRALETHTETGEATREKETHADQWGLVYAAQAGYDPHLILDDSLDFLGRWSARPLSAALDSHPDPTARAHALHDELLMVADALDGFHLGVRFYQMGRYDEAESLLRRFAERYRGREVLNNLGLVALGQATRALAGCDADLATRFALPLVLDGESLPAGVRRRGARDDSACYDLPGFRARIDEAVTLFEAALARDPDYQPAALNLVSAHLLAADGNKALALTENLPETEAARIAEALAIYLFGIGSDREAEDRAEALAILAAMPDNPAALYNRAAITAEAGEDPSDLLTRFLALEPLGPLAERVRERFPEQPPATFEEPEPLAIPTGPIEQATRARLDAMTERDLELDEGEMVTVYREPGRIVVTSENRVIISELILTSPVPLTEIEPAWKQGVVRQSSTGTIIIGIDRLLETRDGHATRLVRFATPSD